MILLRDTTRILQLISVGSAVTTVGQYSPDNQYTSRKLRDRLCDASSEAPRDSCTGCLATITLLFRSKIAVQFSFNEDVYRQ